MNQKIEGKECKNGFLCNYLQNDSCRFIHSPIDYKLYDIFTNFISIYSRFNKSVFVIYEGQKFIIFHFEHLPVAMKILSEFQNQMEPLACFQCDYLDACNQKILLKINQYIGQLGDQEVEKKLHEHFRKTSSKIFDEFSDPEEIIKKTKIYKGKIEIRDSGMGLIKSDDRDLKNIPIQFNNKYFNRALYGSKVLFTIKVGNKGQKLPQVVHVDYNKELNLFGTLNKLQRKLNFQPLNTKFPNMFVTNIPNQIYEQITQDKKLSTFSYFYQNDQNDIKQEIFNNLLVKCKFLEWPSHEQQPYCQIVGLFGTCDDIDNYKRVIMLDHGIQGEGFNSQIKEEEYKIQQEFPILVENEIKRRLDRSEEFTMSIDNKSTKNIDDALSINEELQGNHKMYRVEIHIADVNALINEQSKIFAEAKLRVENIYIGNFFKSMLPTSISRLSSLNVNNLKLSISLIFLMNEDAIIDLSSVSYYETVIRNKLKLSYEQVEQLINDEDISIEEVMQLQDQQKTDKQQPIEQDQQQFEKNYQSEENKERMKEEICKLVKEAKTRIQILSKLMQKTRQRREKFLSQIIQTQPNEQVLASKQMIEELMTIANILLEYKLNNIAKQQSQVSEVETNINQIENSEKENNFAVIMDQNIFLENNSEGSQNFIQNYLFKNLNQTINFTSRKMIDESFQKLKDAQTSETLKNYIDHIYKSNYFYFPFIIKKLETQNRIKELNHQKIVEEQMFQAKQIDENIIINSLSQQVKELKLEDEINKEDTNIIGNERIGEQSIQEQSMGLINSESPSEQFPQNSETLKQISQAYQSYIAKKEYQFDEEKYCSIIQKYINKHQNESIKYTNPIRMFTHLMANLLVRNLIKIQFCNENEISEIQEFVLKQQKEIIQFQNDQKFIQNSGQGMDKALTQIKKMEFAYQLKKGSQELTAIVQKQFTKYSIQLWHENISDYNINLPNSQQYRIYQDILIEISLKSFAPIQFEISRFGMKQK